MKKIKGFLFKIPDIIIFIIVLIIDWWAGALKNGASSEGLYKNTSVCEYTYFYQLAISIREVSVLFMAYFFADKHKPEGKEKAILISLLYGALSFSLWNLYCDYAGIYDDWNYKDYLATIFCFSLSFITAYFNLHNLTLKKTT